MSRAGANHKGFIKIMEQGFRTHGVTYWNDFLELAFNATRQDQASPDPDTEAAYMRTVKKYMDRDEPETIRDHFPRALAHVCDGLNEGACDFLGEVAGSMEVLNKGAGQFFTPFELSLTMAMMQLSEEEVRAKLKANSVITVHEPAVGAGGMLIAVMECLRRWDLPPWSMYFNAWDVSMQAVHMCYIQTSMLGGLGDVVHGNTLSLESWGTYPTPRLRELRKMRGSSPQRKPIVRERSRAGKIVYA